MRKQVTPSTVFVVEHRQVHLDVPLPRSAGGRHYEENVVAHVASTKDLALAWCLANLNYETKDAKRPWWFVICEEVVDSDLIAPTPWPVFVGWGGQLLNEQPISGYVKEGQDAR